MRNFALKLLAALLITAFSVSALMAQTSVSVQKTKDNRFIAQLDASETDIGLRDQSGLVNEITLGIEWWTLLKEPVEKYLFRWKRGSSVRSQQYMLSLNESILQDYPDLLKRFRSLKPSYVEIQIDVWLDFGDNYSAANQNFFKGLPDCLGSSRYAQISGKTFYEMESNYGTRTIDSKVKFLIAKAGSTGDDIVPGSPKDWTEFIQYGSCNIINETGYQIFKNAKGATFMLKVLKIEVPQKEIDRLAKAYLNKEKEDSEVVEEDPEKDTDENKEEKVAEDEGEDFWSGKETADETEQIDDFWTGDQSADDLDFWSGQGTSSEEIQVQKEVAKATGNQFIGEETVTTRMITVYYYDHSKVDGDRVNIYHNGKKIASNITLKGYEKSVDAELKNGVNRISFEALNQGSSGNNTASFRIADANGKDLYNNQWNIQTGYKGTLLLIKK